MKISVVTPSFNQGRFIGRTLASVARQQGAEWDHCVFDGGSTDETLDVLRRFEPAPRWVSEPDRGQAHAVNKGIAATDGEVVGWLNSDDVYYDGALREVAAFLEARPDVDVVYGLADHIDEDDRVLEPYPTRAWSARALERECFICQPAAFVRRSALERHGMLDESLHYCMDYELWLRLAQGGARFAYLERKLAGSRLHAQTKTLGSRVKVHAEINRMLHARLGRVPWRWRVNHGFALAESSHPEDGYLARRIRVARIALRDSFHRAS